MTKEEKFVAEYFGLPESVTEKTKIPTDFGDLVNLLTMYNNDHFNQLAGMVYFSKMLDELPSNRPIYMDSGLWQIRSDDMETVLFQQGSDEVTPNFFRRVAKEIEEARRTAVPF